MPLYLNTASPGVHALEDLTAHDRIALPSRGTSLQAVLLRMAVAAHSGMPNRRALDAITVSMSHPLAMQSLLDGNDAVTTHFASPPYQYQELANPRVHKLLDSYEMLGGPASFSALWARSAFMEENPDTVHAVLNALEEAIALIRDDPLRAANIYLVHSDTLLEVETVRRIIADPRIAFDLRPKNIMPIARFMHADGDIRNLPERVQDLFAPLPQTDPGD
jgi:NitT/TauT family transport system substrate-binding protein